MKTSTITLANGKVVAIELVDANDSTYKNNKDKSIIVYTQEGKMESDSINLEAEVLEEESIEEQCLFCLCSYSKEERKEIAKLISVIEF